MTPAVEAAARMLAAADGRIWPPNTELGPVQRRRLDAYGELAEKALVAVRCSLMGRSCTCWTPADLITAGRRLGGSS